MSARHDGTRVPGGGRLLNVKLSPAEFARVDAECRRLGINRSELVRAWIDALPVSILDKAPTNAA